MVVYEHRRREDGRRLPEGGIAVGRGELVEEAARRLVFHVGSHEALGVLEHEADGPELREGIGEETPPRHVGRDFGRGLEDGDLGDDVLVDLADGGVEGREFGLGLGEEGAKLVEEALDLGPEDHAFIPVVEPVEGLVAIEVDALAELVHEPAMGVEAPLPEAEEHRCPQVVGHVPSPERRAGAARPVPLLDDGHGQASLGEKGGGRSGPIGRRRQRWLRICFS